MYATSFAIGRLSFFLAVLAFALSVIFGTPGTNGQAREVEPRFLLAAAGLGALWMIGIATSVLLAFGLRCDACGRRQVWTSFAPPPKSKLDRAGALTRWLALEALVQRRFACCHCHQEFLLGGNHRPVGPSEELPIR